MIQISRRKLILNISATLICAPAIVRISSLMPVKSIPGPTWLQMEVQKATPYFYDGFFHYADYLHDHLPELTVKIHTDAPWA